MNNCCFYSSLIFINNIILAYKYKYYIYSILFTFLVITSLIYHSYSNIYTNILDKISIILVVLYGAYQFYNKCKLNNNKLLYKILVIITFLSTIYFYFYGYTCNKYCFDITKGNLYHSLLHIISSIGHNLNVLI